MSSFYCSKCGALITDSPDGYISFCPHYPKKEKRKQNKNEMLKKMKEILGLS